jgi:hypothetical protein
MSVPSAPNITSIDSANESLIVNFIPPLNDGGFVIVNYSYSLDNGIIFKISNTYQSPIKINNLINGNTYEIIIKAINAMGMSDSSNMVVGIPINN